MVKPMACAVSFVVSEVDRATEVPLDNDIVTDRDIHAARIHTDVSAPVNHRVIRDVVKACFRESFLWNVEDFDGGEIDSSRNVLVSFWFGCFVVVSLSESDGSLG